MKLSISKAKELAFTLIGAWANYNESMREYMLGIEEFKHIPQNEQLLYWRVQYERWVKASQQFQEYTKAIRNFSNFTTWNSVVEVEYGEIVGFHIPETGSLVYLNAYGSRDDETALCRYGAEHKFLMRIGGLPQGTLIFTQKASYQIDANGQPQFVHPKPEPAF